MKGKISQSLLQHGDSIVDQFCERKLIENKEVHSFVSDLQKCFTFPHYYLGLGLGWGAKALNLLLSDTKLINQSFISNYHHINCYVCAPSVKVVHRTFVFFLEFCCFWFVINEIITMYCFKLI